MYSIRLFEPHDAEQMSIQPMQITDQSLFVDWSHEQWEELGIHNMPSMSGLRADRVIACTGIVPQWKGRAVMWALLADSVNRYDMIWLHRQAVWFLDIQIANGFHRIEAHVHEPFTAAHRWVDMLGFVSEGLMRRFDPTGRDMRLYARVA